MNSSIPPSLPTEKKAPAWRVASISRDSLQYLLFTAALCLTGFFTFGKSAVLGVTYFFCSTFVSSIFFLELRRSGLPSWRAGVPLFYLLLFFALPLFQQITEAYDYIGMPGTAGAWLLIALGMALFYAGATWTTLVFAHGKNPSLGYGERWPFEVLNDRACVFLCALLGAGCQIWSIQNGYFGLLRPDEDNISTTAGVVSTLGQILDIACMAAWCKAFESKRHPDTRWLIIAVLSTACLLYLGIFSGSKWGLVKPVLIVAIAIYGARQRISALAILVFMAFYYFIAYPFVSIFRITYDFGNLSKFDAISKSLEYFLSLDWAYQDRTLSAGGSGSEAFSSLGRGLLEIVAQAVDKTGSAVDFLYGETYLSGFSQLVPRFLWPDKPALNVGNEIGRQYGQIPSSDLVTSISPSQVGELYMNFAFLGVVIGMFLWGCAAAWIDRRLVVNKASWLAVFMAINILWQEAAFAYGPVALLKVTFLLIPFFIIISLLYRVFRRMRVGTP